MFIKPFVLSLLVAQLLAAPAISLEKRRYMTWSLPTEDTELQATGLEKRRYMTPPIEDVLPPTISLEKRRYMAQALPTEDTAPPTTVLAK